MKVTAAIFLLYIFLTPLQSQITSIRGTITDLSNQPIKGVSVKAKNANIFGSSDINGNYRISVPDTISSLVFSKIGFATIIEEINTRTEINIQLPSLEFVELSLKELLQVNVSTVSLNDQKIIDAPGVVSIITKDELRLMGIRTIREALTLIAGFTPLQNDDEQILGVRGIYATTNQKILVMRDGHSLNEANIDLPQTDYSLSIENIKKIEIIRGPGASIYGNSALAAVVNIITTDEEGSSVKVGVGNFGQFDLDAVSNVKIKENSYFMAYGRFSATDGQPFDVTAKVGDNLSYKGTYKTNHYPSNYDVGFKYKNSVFSTFLSVRRHSYKTYWSANGLYTNIDSLLAKPQLKQESFHYGFNIEPRIKENLKLILQHYADYSQLRNYRLLNSIDDSLYLHGRMQLNEWNVFKAGLNYYSIWQYSINGQLLGGISLENRRYLDSWVASNTLDSSKIVYLRKPFIPRGSEIRAAGFFQLQQNLTRWLKIDCGARYDWAENFEASFNPRIALIANFLEKISVKAIFTQAFQAPGYSYRTSNADYSGSIGDLKPERLKTYQAAVRYDFFKTSFFEVTGYYNQLTNLITRPQGLSYYTNIGKYVSYGGEAVGQINLNNIKFELNYSLLLPDKSFLDQSSKVKNVYKNEFRFFPKHSSNASFIYRFWEHYNVALYAHYSSAYYAMGDMYINERVTLNTSVTLQEILKNTDFQVSVYNITNKQYKLGDPSVVPIEQPGRWFMISARYTFSEK